MAHRITLIPGDGIGPELIEATRRVLEATGLAFDWDTVEAGADVMDKYGTPLPETVLDSIRANGVALKGPITTPVGTGFRSVNVAIRQALDLYANLRPARSMKGIPVCHPDVDLVVYGEGACRRVHAALKELVAEDVPSLRRPTMEELTALHAAHRVDTPLSFHAFAKMQRRKVNELRFLGRETFFRFVKRPSDVEGSYGDRRFTSVGTATLTAQVTDDRQAIFTPCRYGVEDVALLDGTPIRDLRDIVSFRGRFSEQAISGEWVEARGTVERVTTGEGSIYQRLVVGSRSGDYLAVR